MNNNCHDKGDKIAAELQVVGNWIVGEVPHIGQVILTFSVTQQRFFKISQLSKILKEMSLWHRIFDSALAILISESGISADFLEAPNNYRHWRKLVANLRVWKGVGGLRAAPGFVLRINGESSATITCLTFTDVL